MRCSFLALAIVCVSAGPALTQDSGGSISINPTGDLLAKGAAVRVSVAVQCPAGYRGFPRISCLQRAGKTVVGGEGGTDFTCLGGPQNVDILFPQTVGRSSRGVGL